MTDEAPIVGIRAVNSVRAEVGPNGEAIAVWTHQIEIRRQGGEWEPIPVVGPKPDDR